MLAAPARATLDAWYAMVARHELGPLDGLLEPGIVFRSPMAFTPYRGRETVALILRTVTSIFLDFRYEREFAAGSHDAALEFAARVGTRELKGVDLIRFSESGAIAEFEVMIRPASGLTALGEAMGARIGAQLNAAAAAG